MSNTAALWNLPHGPWQAILSKIGAEADIEKFNSRLQQLLLGSKGLLAGWLDAQKLLQEVGAIAARARSRIAKAENEDGKEVSIWSVYCLRFIIQCADLYDRES